MNVIFLDIDGVLNYSGSPARYGGCYGIDKTRTALLDWLVERTNASIVISSTWRLLHPIQELAFLLRTHGLKHGEILGITPDFGEPRMYGSSMRGERGDEVLAWVEQHRADVRSFIALDDDSDFRNCMDRLVKTSWRTGLLPEHCFRAEALLTA